MLSRDDHIIYFTVMNFNESSVQFNIRIHIDNEDKTEEQKKNNEEKKNSTKAHLRIAKDGRIFVDTIEE